MEFIETDGCITLYDESGVYCGKITYVPSGEKCLIIDHTIVEDEHQGKGYAAQLVKKVVDKAVAEDKTIMPLCSYARAQFNKNKEYQKVEQK